MTVKQGFLDSGALPGDNSRAIAGERARAALNCPTCPPSLALGISGTVPITSYIGPLCEFGALHALLGLL